MLENLENCSKKSELLVDIDKKFLLNEILTFSQEYRSDLKDSIEICSSFSKDFLCSVMILDDNLRETKFSPYLSIASINIQKDSTLNRTDYLILLKDIHSNDVFGKPKILLNSTNLLWKLSIFCIQNFGYEHTKQVFDFYYPLSDSITENQKRNYIYDQVFNKSQKRLHNPIIENNECPLSCLASIEAAEVIAPDEIKLSPESSRPFMNFTQNGTSLLSSPDLHQPHLLSHDQNFNDPCLNINNEPIKQNLEYKENKGFKYTEKVYENMIKPVVTFQNPSVESNISCSEIPKPYIPIINPNHFNSNQYSGNMNFNQAFINNSPVIQNKFGVDMNEKLRIENNTSPFIPPPTINTAIRNELHGKLQENPLKINLSPFLKGSNLQEMPQNSKDLRPPTLLQSSSQGYNEVKPPPLLPKKSSLDTVESASKNSNQRGPSIKINTEVIPPNIPAPTVPIIPPPCVLPIPTIRFPPELQVPVPVPMPPAPIDQKFPVSSQGPTSLAKSSVISSPAAPTIQPAPKIIPQSNSYIDPLPQNLAQSSNIGQYPQVHQVNPMVPVLQPIAPIVNVNVKENNLSKSQQVPQLNQKFIPEVSQVPGMARNENSNSPMKPNFVNPINVNPIKVNPHIVNQNKEESKVVNVFDNKEKPVDLTSETKGIKIQPIAKANPAELVINSNIHNIVKGNPINLSSKQDPIPFYNKNLDGERLKNHQNLQKTDKTQKTKIIDCEECKNIKDKPSVELDCKCKLCETHIQIIAFEMTCCWCEAPISQSKIEEIKKRFGW